jgi:hypothetical protein
MTSENVGLEDAVGLIKHRFSEEGIEISHLDQRDYPGESIFVARVAPSSVAAATVIANSIDSELASQGFKGFVTVRALESDTPGFTGPLRRGVLDQRARKLTTLVAAHSRTSEAQPSLAYVRESVQAMSTVTSLRHHLIFGRRGAGKTALMLEARRLAERKDSICLWINIQTYRRESADRTFAWIGQRLCERILASYQGKLTVPEIVVSASKLAQDLEGFTSSLPTASQNADHFIPRLHAVIRRFIDGTGVPLLLFLDDFHYLSRSDQPRILDMLHAIVRDTNAWLKVAGIRHLSRWFNAQPPTGLQIGHDADQIDLDVTLENPSHAKTFLERILARYAVHVGITSLSGVFSTLALDRLVLASGGVPRDYLVLSASAIREAQNRGGSRIVGVQDVNKAAGQAAKAKIEELEDDAASDTNVTSALIKGLQVLRKFCIEQKSCTYFRVDFGDKETLSTEYGIIQDLMDLRLTHLVERSLSDEREAGRRSEVYMLDLSQYSGQRLKRKLKVLDFSSGDLVLKETGTTKAVRVGSTSKQRLGILRRGPLLDLHVIAQ